VVGGIELELSVASGIEDRPASETTGHRDDVVLGIATIDAEGVQFEQFAAVVLVQHRLLPRHPFRIRRRTRLPIVEIKLHRRMAGGGQQHAAETAEYMRADGVALVAGHHHPDIALVDRDVEVVDPEVDQYLFELARRIPRAQQLRLDRLRHHRLLRLSRDQRVALEDVRHLRLIDLPQHLHALLTVERLQQRDAFVLRAALDNALLLSGQQVGERRPQTTLLSLTQLLIGRSGLVGLFLNLRQFGDELLRNDREDLHPLLAHERRQDGPLLLVRAVLQLEDLRGLQELRDRRAGADGNRLIPLERLPHLQGKALQRLEFRLQCLAERDVFRVQLSLQPLRHPGATQLLDFTRERPVGEAIQDVSGLFVLGERPVKSAAIGKHRGGEHENAYGDGCEGPHVNPP